eukprot:1887316-Rhodomonas_salina.1
MEGRSLWGSAMCFLGQCDAVYGGTGVASEGDEMLAPVETASVYGDNVPLIATLLPFMATMFHL